MVQRMWEILTTLTEEAQQAALAKCKELNFDPNRGIVSLDESFINLTAARSMLMDAIEKKKLIQLPITVQNTIISSLEAIAKYQSGLMSGSDEIVNLGVAIEQLNASIWTYGLHNLSDEVLGYQTKLNQLKDMEVEARKLKNELESGIQVKEDLNRCFVESVAQVEVLQKNVASAAESATSATTELAKTTEASQKVSALLITIQQSETTTTQQLSEAKASNAEVGALEKRIKEFYADIDAYRTHMTATDNFASKTVLDNNEAISNMIRRLAALEEQIKAQIQKATGFSLFHSFQTRQESLRNASRFWGVALGVLVLVSIALTVVVMTTTKNFDTAFFLKLSLSIPIIYAITFCNVQYAHERKMEEEYAFKSNISISLVPYQELVESW